METVHEFLNVLASRGVKLSVESGRLNCYAQKGMLTNELRDGIVRFKPEIIALLEQRPVRTSAPVEFPLSAGQKGLYLLQKLHPAMSAYNVPLASKMRGRVDAALLQKTWDQVLEQFPILTARIIEHDGALVQRLGVHSTVQQRHVSFANDAELSAFIREQGRKPFDLNDGPLARIEWFTQDDDQSVLLITVHHIVFDGTSAVILLKTFFETYQQLCDGRTVRPRELAGYREFVEWEGAMLASTEGASHAAYWQQQLAGELTPLELLPDAPHALQTFEGRTLIRELPEELGQWVREYSRAHSVPPSVIFLAAFQLLLHRYTNQEDIVVGMPVMGRAGQKFANAIGYFVNMVPLRTRCDGELTLNDFLRRTQGTMLDALVHSAYPFPLMADKLKVRQGDKNPIFQVSYAYQNFVKPEDFASLLNLQAVKLDGLAGIVQEGYSDLALEIFESSVFSIYLKYNPDLYSEGTIETLYERYCVLLRGLRENPKRLLREYSILTDRERQQVLYDFNATRSEYPQDKCVHDLFLDQVARHPERIAVIAGDASLTYAQLEERSRALALWLREQGVGPESFVGIRMERSLELMVALLGILRAGAAYVPLDPSYPEDRIAYMIEDSGVKIVLTREVVETAGASRASGPPLPVVTPNNLAYVIYTSGSTGRPKGVMIEHRSAVNYLTYCLNNYLSGDDSRAASFLHFPLTFDASITSLFVPLIAGKAVDTNPHGTTDLFKDGEFLDRGYDFVKLTPAHLLLLRSNAANLPASYFRKRNLFVVGGEALTHDHVDFLARLDANVEIVNEYGPTEATVGCSTARFRASEAANITIGAPIANTRIYILDAYGQPQPIGIAGELHIAGDCLARGYLNRPELTAEKFVDDPFVPGARMYKSGDLARWNADGTLQYHGRIDTQVKIRGYRIETGEIEACLSQHPAVQDSAVITRGEGANRQLVAFYVAAAPVDDLRAHAARTLPEYMIPVAFVRIDAVPLNVNGKVDQRALARIDVTIGSSQAYVAPRNETESGLVAIWSEILNVAADKIGVNDNFFELGGHSLLATQLISKIRTALNVDLPLKTLFERTTVAQLAEAITGAAPSGIPAIVPADRSQRLPLSFAQERLWFIHQLEPESPGYNVPGAVTIRGALDVDALERAFNAVIARHENLRTIFPSEHGLAQQRILDAVDFTLERLTARDSAEAREICLAEAVRPFDLAHGPLLRGKVIRLAADEHILLLNMHHIVSDGWSMGILVRELGALMNGAELQPLTIQYADYSVWQRQWLESSGLLDEQLAYWQRQLAGIPESLDLATDYARPAVQSFAGATHAFALDADTTARLKKIAERHGATLYMVLLAAFDVLLHRYTGQDDICVGSAIANRNYGETEALIGMFVNTLVMRSRIEADDTFDALLARVKSTCLEAYEHQDAPFEKVVDAVRPRRNMAVSPLFQVMLILQNTDMGAPDARIERYPLHSGISKFDLTFEFTETGDGLAGAIEYCTALYKAQTIERMAGHFRALCRAIAGAAGAKLHELDYLGAAEKRQLLVVFNDTRAEFPKDKRIHDFFVEQVVETPDAIAVRYEDRALTYRELYERSHALALYLQSEGAGPDTIVGLSMERSLEMMIAIMGTVMAGGAYMPLDPSYPDDRLTYMIADSNAPVVLTQSKWAARIGALAGGAKILSLDTDVLPDAPAELRNDVKPHNLCYVIYTSGSTGRPKGVLNEHGALVNRLVWMQKCYPIGPGDVVLQKTPYSFDVSVWEFFWPMMTGASVVFAAPDGHKDVAYLETLINEAGVTTLHYVPSMLYTFLDSARGNCPSVRQVFCSGEALDRKGADRYRARFPNAALHNLYGPTEAAIDVTSYDCTRPEYPFIPIGMPIDNIRIHILDAHGNLQPVGVPGELHIAGDGLARGYLNRPELTREKFVADPFTPGGRMYKTGDLARWLEDGNIQYLGRIDTQVKIRGFRIELGEIESRLNEHPAVQDSVVIAQGQDANKRLVAFYSAKGDTPSGEELRAHLLQTLPEYMVPSAFVRLDAIPTNSNGKADRGALMRMDVTMAAGRDYVAPRNELESRLRVIWADVLNADAAKIGVHDGFFELGGHSLLATQLVSKIRAALGVDLPLKALFERTTIAQLAELIADSAKSDVPPIVPLDRAQYERLPLSFAQERLWFIHQLEPDSAGYNVPGAVTIRGELDVDRLDAAFNRIIERHETLRTIFPSDDGRAQQRILDRLDFALERIDARDLDEARAICQADATRPFDLANGPLIRGKIIRLSHDEHILMLNMHHIVSDGWSMGVLVRELGALLDGRELPALPIQYADYSVWQREWLGSGVLDRQLDYWKQKLDSVPESLDLATDFPRPAVQSFAGATQTFALDATLTTQLKRMAEERGSTLYMTLLAAFNVLLHRYTGQSDIVVGSPIANRQYGETEGLIGMFVNTLAMRTFVDGGEPFDNVLANVRATCLEAYENQDAPFEKIVDALQLQRNLAVSPLFQIMLILQNADMGLADSRIERHPLDTKISKFDLTFEFTEIDGRLDGVVEYATALFKASTITRMTEHFRALCEAIVAAPSLPVREYEIIGNAEKHRLLVELNDTSADYPAGRCMHQLFAEQTARDGEQVAVICGSGQLTYRELYEKSQDLALCLQSLGVAPDALVGVCMERSLDMIVGMLGILQAGGAYVPLDPNYPGERLAYMIGDSRASIVLTQKSLLDTLRALVPEGTRLIALDEPWPESTQTELRQNVRPHHLGYVIYTSGSTGNPKGVAIEHHSAVTLIDWAREVYSDEELRGVLAATSICFDLSVYEIFVTLAAGGTIILVPNALGLAELADKSAVTLINTVPSAMDELVRMNAVPASVKTVNLAGEPLSAKLVDRIYDTTTVEKVYDLYGPSEDTTYSTYVLRRKNAAQTIGRPIANTQVYILDAHGRIQPIGVPGELHISGDGLARGYLHRPELTREKFVGNPFRPGTRMYKTGDLARWTEDGTLQYLGRIDTQVKIRGFRIELGEIEARLGRHPAIQDCVVIAQGQDANKHLVAFYVSGDHTELAYDELRAHLRQTLPDYMVPTAFARLDAIPLSPNGKVDRRALSRLDVTAASVRQYVAPRNETERRLAEIWAEVLGRDAATIGIDDNFFELGGHSLSAVQLLAKINRAFEQHLPLAILFTASNIAALATQLDGGSTAMADVIVPIQAQGDGHPVFAVPGVGGNVLSLRSLRNGKPLFALQGGTHASVEETARINVAALQSVQPSGPYTLVGHSYGGVVAYEMARQLVEKGESVASLVLLDSLAPSIAQRTLDPELADDEIVAMINERGLEITEEQFRTFCDVYRANLRCYRAYAPAALNATIEVALYRATEDRPDDLPADYGWDALLAQPVRAYDVDADHFSILEKVNL